MNFWLFLLAAFLATLYALWTRLTVWMLLGALLYAPFAMFMLSNTPLGWLAIVVWVIYAGSTLALRQDRRGLAALLAVPAYLLVAYVAWTILSAPAQGLP
jgi:hypothetical protein